MIEKTTTGFCECGCGQKTRISLVTDRSKSWYKGQPIRFIQGHQSRSAQSETKLCIYCKQHKELDLFYNKKGVDSNYKRKVSACKECMKKKGRERKRYGLSYTTLLALVEAQNNLCAICGRQVKLGGRGQNSAYVDHNHKTGQIRELLCAHCNTGIGMFKDNPELLKKAIDYLVKHKS